MPSPLPGMNPYLEQDDVWEDFHHNFFTWTQASLNSRLGENYFARIEARLYIRELSGDERRFFGRADVGVSSRGGPQPQTAVVELDAPVELVLPAVDIGRESWLEIRDRRDRRVVTVIELLSPTNKRRGPDRDAYLSKRNGILASRTHLVEIDLRRGGERPSLPPLPDCDYYVFISRYEARPRIGFWPIGLRDPLPTISVPLSDPDPPIELDLQQLLHQTYDSADYGKTIYAETPDPPLSKTDAEWARQFTPAPE
ncbi:MAG: DUF4058 family protein [Pirellulales bacterium]